MLLSSSFNTTLKILHVDVLPGAEGTATAVVRFADEISANNGRLQASRSDSFPHYGARLSSHLTLHTLSPAVDLKNGVLFEGTHEIVVTRD